MDVVARGYMGATVGACQPKFHRVAGCAFETRYWRALSDAMPPRMLPCVASRNMLQRLQPGGHSALEGTLRRGQRERRLARRFRPEFGRRLAAQFSRGIA